jgi:hypothetical protein
MKKLIGIAALSLALVGCQRAQLSSPTSHVASADPCDRPSSTMGNGEYELNVENPPLHVACSGPMRMGGIGRDFRVIADIGKGILTIEVQARSARQRFMIERVRRD